MTERSAKKTRSGRTQGAARPNILVLCIHGVSFDRQYCTMPICTPSRATMWTGVHAKHPGLWDNTNFDWIGELSHDIPTIGHLCVTKVTTPPSRVSGTSRQRVKAHDRVRDCCLR